MTMERVMSQATKTVDHKAIRRWVEERNGHPSIVRGTGKGDSDGILRIDFDKPEASLKKIDWEDFFKVFDERELAFLHQDETADGQKSRFFKFVRRDGDED
jgi:hypothetical protein